jgi:hypothetical protein
MFYLLTTNARLTRIALNAHKAHTALLTRIALSSINSSQARQTRYSLLTLFAFYRLTRQPIQTRLTFIYLFYILINIESVIPHQCISVINEDDII